VKDIETAKQFFFEGVRLLEEKKFLAAEIQFTCSLEIMPDRVSTLNNLSVIKLRQKKFCQGRGVRKEGHSQGRKITGSLAEPRNRPDGHRTPGGGFAGI